MSVNRNPAARKKCSSCNSRVSNVSNESNRCIGCACDQLRDLKVNSRVNIFLKSGREFNNVRFLSLNNEDCCAYFLDGSRTLVVNCKDIEAILLPV
ncbi:MULTISPECIES: hydrolase [Lysinibacillus]|uniref:hydrolase n=1 Tax=Lysinibacillus TaxID=400634 RepID=UPI00214B4107|nr:MULTISPECIES: hydrolase [Lysinibacillus]UUV27074.1 hydrolase [Lysinibacillus sp. FN11]UYB45335.1 hydrolase [Lysinibacillus capsici]